jgi:hypothetical protein
MAMPSALLRVATLSILLGAPAAAQAIRGVVVDSASRQPIPGVVVSLLDSNAALLGRIITNQRGRFTVPSASSIRRLRIQRLGFRMREVVVQVAPAGFTDVEVSIVTLPTLLEPVLSTGNSRCRRRDDQRATFALLEQARAGVLAASVSRGRDTAVMRVLTFERTLGDRDRIVSHVVRYDSAITFLPFAASKSPRDFIRTGFVREASAEMEFYAPDAEVLLSSDFAEGYCFRLADRDERRPGQVGLGFEPAVRPDGRQTISGVLWIDTVKRALVELEYRYLDMGRLLDAARPGGRVSFVEARPGVVLIDRWSLRLPRQRADTSRDIHNADVIRNWHDPVETGAELALARWDDGVEWRGRFGALRATVTVDGVPAPGRDFRLDDSDYQATSDSAGRLIIDELLPGPFTLTPTSPVLAVVGLAFPSVLRFDAARDSVVTATIEVPTLQSLAFDRCVKEKYGKADAPRFHLVVGRVVRPDGTPVARAAIKAKWFAERRYFVGEPKPIMTGTDGRFELCLPESARNAMFTVVASTAAGEGIVSAIPVTVVTPLTVIVDRPPLQE